jgi:TolB-like protein/DNA-binding winged helix-turn-helix (wHTH) protein/Flp pilus assembly protein TadD
MRAAASRGPVVRFGRFALDHGRGALLGAEGAEVPLRPKSFALLALMVENAGRLLGRAEIMGAVWPGVFVTDDSLGSCVREVRAALGDADARLLRTVPRRGYLFAAEVSRAAEPAFGPGAPAAAGGRARAGAGGPAAAVPAPPAGQPLLIVLPFEEIGAEPDQAYLAAGLTADLATDLTRSPSLHVVSPRRGSGWQPGRALPSVHRPDGRVAPPPLVADYLVSGAVQRAGDRVRVTARLEDAASGVRLWADRADRPRGDLFEVQEELAELLAARVAGQVGWEEMRRARGHPPASPDAYDLFLRGRWFMRSRWLRRTGGEADTIRAREMFERAIAEDPGHAPSHAWLAYTLLRGFLHRWGEPRGGDALAPALAAARRAARLDPDSPTCISCLGLLVALHGRWDEALEAARAAAALGPGVFETRQAYAQVLTLGGEPDEAVRQYNLALSHDPFHPVSARTRHARALLLAGRREEALHEARWAAARLPDHALSQQVLAVAAMEAGHLEEARAAVQEVLRIGPDWTVRGIDYLSRFRRPADGERIRSALRAAGLPEG